MATRGRRAATLTFRRRRRRAWRPAKTPRSDPSEDGGAEAGAGDHDLPELRKLRNLEDRENTRAEFQIGRSGAWAYAHNDKADQFAIC